MAGLRFVLLLIVVTSLAACAGGGGRAPTKTMGLKQVSAGEVFATAVRDICFGALVDGQAHGALATSLGFSLAKNVSEKFRQDEADILYRAEYASVPVLVAVGDKGKRCSVTVVRGDFEALKRMGEEEISFFSTRFGPVADDYIAFVESHPLREYALKFTVLSGSDIADRAPAGR